MSGIYVNPNTKFVGIGTIAPTSRLQVDGNAHFGSNADTDAHTIIGSASVTCSNATGAGALIVNQQGTGKIFELQNSGTARITVLDGGNVGIGIANPTQKLYVVGDTRIEGNLTVNGTQTVINTDVITTEQLLVTNNGTGPALVVNQTGAQPVIDIQDDGVSVMKIINNGNIGMGTTDPTQRLHVQGSILATTQHLGPAADTSNAPGFSWSGDADTGLYRPAADVVGLVTGSVERMRVLANGNVGIGTTNPLGKLEVNIAPVLVGGDPTYKGDIRLISQGGGSILNGAGGIEFKLSNSGPGYGWRINAPDATGASEGTPLSIQSRMGSATWTNNLIIKGDGNVGIGTTNPQAKLHVEGYTRITGSDGTVISFTPAAGASGMMRVDMTAAGGTSLVTTGGGTNLQVYQANGNNRIFSTAGGASSDITFGVTHTGEILGKVGIGTTTPQAKLHVNGTLNVQGVSYLNNFLNLTDIVDQTTLGETWPVISFSGAAGGSGLVKGPGTYDWGMIKGGTNYGYYGRVVVGPHAANTIDQGFVTSGWTNQFVVNGSNGNAYLRGTLTQGSDGRLKTNVRSLTSNLEKVMKLRPVVYNRKVFQRDSNGEITSETIDIVDKIGFIAQEVKPIIPEVIEGNENSHNPEHGLSIQYQNMLAIAIGAIQELKNEIESLKSKI